LLQEVERARDRGLQDVLVSQVTWQLRTESKTRRRVGNPFCDCFPVRYGVKSGVAFDCGEALAIEAQEVSLAAISRIEIADPAFVGPDRTTKEKVPGYGHDDTIPGGQRKNKATCEVLSEQGKKEEAQQMLVEIYGRFTEGFDTKDLQEARTLLEELTD